MTSSREHTITPEEVTALEVWASPANMRRGLNTELDRIRELVLKLTTDWRRITDNA